MLVAPSILSLDFRNFNESMRILNSNVKMLHFDVMDGHFVPNITFGPDILRTFRKSTNLFLDVHLMIDDPMFYADKFIKAGADSITFHYENFNDLNRCKEMIDYLRNYYVKVGISIKPGTNVEIIKPILNDVDIVLVMSVEPGFGGQKFIESALEKISYLYSYRFNNNLKYLIEVDGGINDKTAPYCINAGADILVAGSYVFNGDIIRNLNTLTHIK